MTGALFIELMDPETRRFTRTSTSAGQSVLRRPSQISVTRLVTKEYHHGLADRATRVEIKSAEDQAEANQRSRRF
ncbi:MAG: hypothetical protein KF693_18210 [Nitrospira sp.]|nr:hypothetical protein [Nitrospira sp.]